jgi:hypothetical protein
MKSILFLSTRNKYIIIRKRLFFFLNDHLEKKKKGKKKKKGILKKYDLNPEKFVEQNVNAPK